jgi:peptidoglycan/LPS O-acetylase OafA/YrhL
MNRATSFTGPLAALAAFNCPVCLVAMAGMTAAVGSLMPFVRGAYWAVVLGLAALFLLYLFRSWQTRRTSARVLAIGAFGLAALIHQAWSGADGAWSYVPALSLTTASLAVVFANRTPAGSCCQAGTEKLRRRA